MNVAREFNTLYFCVGTLFLMIGVLSAQLSLALRRIRRLENPRPAVIDTCAHGYVRPCPICDRGPSHGAGVLTWIPVREAAG